MQNNQNSSAPSSRPLLESRFELPPLVKPAIVALAFGIALSFLVGLASEHVRPPAGLLALASGFTATGRALLGAGLLVWGLDANRSETSVRAAAAILAGALLLGFLAFV